MPNAKNPETVRLLMEAGADIDARSKRGSTPLHYARNESVAIALLEAGADWTIKEKHGETAVQKLRGAAVKGRAEVAGAIERWVAARERAGTVNACLVEAQAQQGPGL